MKVNSGILLKGTNKEITSPEGGFVNFRKPLMSAGLALMKIVLKPSTKNVLLPLGLAEWMAATDALIQKKISGSERRALIISNEGMEYILKIVKYLQRFRFTGKKR